MTLPPRAQKFRQDRQIVDPKTGYPTNEFLRSINTSVILLNYLADIQAGVEAAQAAAAAAQATADLALSQSGGEATGLANSYVTDIIIEARSVVGDYVIEISDHNRVYATNPPTTILVNGDTLTGLMEATRYYIYYDQPSRLGGNVVYQLTINPDEVAQVGDRHSVGTVVTPSSGDPPNNGRPISPPGGSYT